jgi:hypothetical protein
MTSLALSMADVVTVLQGPVSRDSAITLYDWLTTTGDDWLADVRTGAAADGLALFYLLVTHFAGSPCLLDAVLPALTLLHNTVGDMARGADIRLVSAAVDEARGRLPQEMVVSMGLRECVADGVFTHLASPEDLYTVLLSGSITPEQKLLTADSARKSVRAFAVQLPQLLNPQNPLVGGLVRALRSLPHETTPAQVCAGLHRGWVLSEVVAAASDLVPPKEPERTWAPTLAALLDHPHLRPREVYVPSVAEAAFFVGLVDKFALNVGLAADTLLPRVDYVTAATQRFLGAIHFVRDEGYLIHDIVPFPQVAILRALDILWHAREAAGTPEALAYYANTVGLPDTLMDMARHGWPEPPTATEDTRRAFGMDGYLAEAWFVPVVTLMQDWTSLVSDPAGAMEGVNRATRALLEHIFSPANVEQQLAEAAATSRLVLQGLENARQEWSRWSKARTGWITAVAQAGKPKVHAGV